jgi:hypothetical protein
MHHYTITPPQYPSTPRKAFIPPEEYLVTLQLNVTVLLSAGVSAGIYLVHVVGKSGCGQSRLFVMRMDELITVQRRARDDSMDQDRAQN